MNKLEEINKLPGKQGRASLIKHLQGKRLSRSEAIKAKCYECSNYYIDGAYDCEMEDCPLHPYMPYRGKKSKEVSYE